MNRYELRVLLHSWGLIVDLEIATRKQILPPESGILIEEGVYVVIAPSVQASDTELQYLLAGIRRIAKRFAAEFDVGEDNLVFSLDYFWSPPTDCQDNAIELAVVGWAMEQLGLQDEPANVSFDRLANRYEIDFNDAIWR